MSLCTLKMVEKHEYTLFYFEFYKIISTHINFSILKLFKYFRIITN